MEDIQYFNSIVVYTRISVLALSICTVVISLIKYNLDTTPILSIFEDIGTVEKSHQIIYDMIQDRNLIATLVAAQASIFCPLFLLLTSPLSTYYEYASRTSFSTADIWRIMIEHFCQFLMPVGLFMSWLFCITFDKKTKTALQTMMNPSIYAANDDAYYYVYVIYLITALKYLIILVLLIEVVAVSCSFIKHTSFLYMTKQQYAIQLSDDEKGIEGKVYCSHLLDAYGIDQDDIEERIFV
ncbi:MAG: hypothetical protein EXX96DRAFT_575538 [Benjaminiella poitrasii]|nr:MAG: hypothetical protein EXX96DRAFT_575538 [Benjaminiella poitrasii]